MRQPLLTTTASYQSLRNHAAQAREWQMRELFAQDPQRFERLSAEAAGLFLDYSKNRLDGRTLELLAQLARERGVERLRDAMFAGEKINLTENRAVLHTALRAPRTRQITVDGQDITADVHGVLDRVKVFSDSVRSGAWKGHTGAPITDIVNIGIGGSDLGPKMVCLALRQFAHPRLTMHFVSNVDGHDMDAALSRVNPETTLFIIASKTFTTAETMMNANTARAWFLQQAPEEALAKHFVAVSTNVEAIKTFGIDPANMFPFWDWVGGRYSVWSAIGLPVALCVGFGYFSDFLAGAHAMDEHFRTTPIEQNLPMIMGLVGFWNREFLDCPSVSIAPYHQDLNRFPAYLQQLDMESNGKRVTRAGDPITDYETGPVIWGDVGTNGQHAYFQLLHQGTDVTPIDFIAALRPAHEFHNHHAALLANCFAQSEAFMKGKTTDEVRQDLAGQPADEIERLAPHKTFPGNRPSNTILMDYLNPATLGALIALYEHKVFVQGALWDVNSYDQWGVELGKVLAKKIEAELNGDAQPAQHDSSTNGLIARAKAAV
ncbi:glucose-6-phosphate isomerase [Massilia sp. WF1]|uniref:glucose-6-phosphate isomerase n=1 Tax=unclassified Massilia TaxID=2609279 RepID=UPI0006499D53|nr:MULTISPECIES: glucose-6-phosphate isomerase [unclassified Massilia]ALK98458.1 glucose-6-phosphate isomerase [Massilia sp. WG5]KLU37627.1 glucose-6-phosphate isomerase [Massilia sp. WF1]